MRLIELFKVTEAPPLPADWDPGVYKPSTSFAKQVRYAMDRARKLGGGSARITFDIEYEGRPTALKIARNKKGLAQNEFEAQMLSDHYAQSTGLLIPLIDYDQENPQPHWIHTEKAAKAKPNDIKRFFGVKPDELDRLLRVIFNTSQWIKYSPQETQAAYDQVEANEYLYDLTKLAMDFDLPTGDFAKPSSYGIYDGRLVLIDVGLSWDVYRQHYESISESMVPQEVLNRIRQIRREVRQCEFGNPDEMAGCGIVSEELSEEFGWEQTCGDFRFPDGTIDEHCWNIMPDGTVVDATADQLGGEDILIIPPSDPRHKLYLQYAKESINEDEQHYGKSLADSGYQGRTVQIFRAAPAHQTQFRPNDWVTTSRKFAKGHADHVAAVDEEDAHVIMAFVDPRHVYHEHNPGEFSYRGPEPRRTRVVYQAPAVTTEIVHGTQQSTHSDDPGDESVQPWMQSGADFTTAPHGWHESISESRAQYPKVISATDLYALIEEMHHSPEDFEGGDITDRIYAYDVYHLTEVPTKSIERGQWNVYKELSWRYQEMYSKGQEPPPIVIDENGNIIDGTHRHEAAYIVGKPTVLAYVGREENRSDHIPDYEEEDEWHPTDEY